MSERWLESASWAAQTAFFFIGLGAVYFAWRQITEYKLMELLKYIEDEEFRRFRRIVLLQIKNRPDFKWWEKLDDKEPIIFEEAASGVCARFDILALLIFTRRPYKRPSYNGKIFIRNWRLPIIETHEALIPYLEHRREGRKTAYDNFTKLRDEAVRDAHRSGLMLETTKNYREPPL